MLEPTAKTSEYPPVKHPTVPSCVSGVCTGVSVAKNPRTAAREIHQAIHQVDSELTLFFCSPDYDLAELGAEMGHLFGDRKLIGCTTAGEITPAGYLKSSVTGVSLPSSAFQVATRRIDGLQRFELAQAEQCANAVRAELDQRAQDGVTAQNSFGFLMIDGLSCREEPVVSALSQRLGGIQLFGGSAGDGESFRATYLYHDGAFRADCAVFSLVQTHHPFTVFKTQHFIESHQRMVVTEADPKSRVVTEINGLPAGREYARMVGLEVSKLTPMIFATYPVVVRIGGDYYVRSIQKVNDDESLTFFCAIDEGVVLTVAKGVDLVENLEALFGDVRAAIGQPMLVLGCDCILRHLEIEQAGIKETVSRILQDNRVIGFSTYGEQYNAMHVNQTFTGVAIGVEKV